jgi:hypothetical protein
MTIPLAQNFPGMEWIPLMVLLPIVATVLGVTALIFRPFPRLHRAGVRLAISAIVVGIASTLFLLAVVGNEVYAFVYAFLMFPALLGGIAFAVYPRPPNSEVPPIPESPEHDR